MSIVYPNNFFDLWRKNNGIYNFADVNNRMRKKHIADNLETISPPIVYKLAVK